MTPKDEAWAVFWCSLLQPVLYNEIDPKDANRFLKKLSQQERVFPDGTRRKPAFSTLRRKLRIYREEGFQALFRQRRSDRGQSRQHAPQMIERAIEIKRDQSHRSDETINKFLEAEFQKTIPKSTLYRYLRQAGATRLKLGVVKKPVRRRWTRAHTHDLWVGDFEDGPYVLHEGTPVKAYLSVFIDCFSRYLVEGRYYFRENLDILIDSLLRAWAIHGASSELYVDNAKIYHSHALRAVCYALNIRLIFRKVRDPAGGGLIERLILTIQEQFEEEVRRGDILTLEKLNRALGAWKEVSYHRRPHSETGEPPKDRYDRGLTARRPVDMEAAIQYFLKRERRRVHKEFSDVQLHGRFYRVDKRYRGDRVEVRYDPFSSPDSVFLYSLEGHYLGKGVVHHREQGEPPDPPPPAAKLQYNYLDLLVQEHDAELESKARGIDYRKAMAKRTWTFSAFAKALAQLLGRKGGLTAFTTEELEALEKFHQNNLSLTEAMLIEAFEQTSNKTLPYILHELHNRTDRKEP
jgi:transposase InsO family protein